MKRNGARALIEALAAEKVDTIFGFPGGAVLPLTDELYAAEIRFILARHEQGAAHAADGYARATGRVGVCVATSGPGATNLVTGIATAYMDSIPMVALTGQVGTAFIGNDAFQEADICGITRPITKHNYLVRDVDELPRIVREAFYVAREGRQGPVVVDVPKDVQIAETSAPVPDKVELRTYKPVYEGNPRQIRKLADAIKSAQKPLLYAGGGIISSGGSAALTELARTTRIPVTTTMMGLGCFPEDDDLALGMLGMHGTRAANMAIMKADLIIAVGARFDDRVTGRLDDFAPEASVIHVDIDPASIGKNVRVDLPVVGDARRVLEELNKLVEAPDCDPWRKQVAEWKAKFPLGYSDDGTLKPQYVVEKIHEVTRGEAIIATEVGQNQMWAAQFYTYTKPRTWLSSGGLGTMGYGFPAAIGAKVGCPEVAVFDIAGDGSIQMNIQELATAVLNKINVKVAILNNGYLGMVRQWQELFYGRRYAFTPLGGVPDFVKLAEAYGAVGMRVETPEEVVPALEKALAADAPVLMDFRVAPEENVFPMVPAGAALHQMIDSTA